MEGGVTRKRRAIPPMEKPMSCVDFGVLQLDSVATGYEKGFTMTSSQASMKMGILSTRRTRGSVEGRTDKSKVLIEIDLLHGHNFRLSKWLDGVTQVI